MGLLVDGEWQDRWYDTKSTGGRFVRKESAFRSWVKADGWYAFGPRIWINLFRKIINQGHKTRVESVSRTTRNHF